MQKQTTLNDLIAKINLIRRVTKWRITGFFILGYPGETKEEIKQTIQLSLRLPLDKVNFGILMPLPGTKAAIQAEEHGFRKDTDLVRMSEYRSTFVPRGMSEREFRNLFRWGFIRFYARPRIIAGFIREIKSLDQIKILFRRFGDVVLP